MYDSSHLVWASSFLKSIMYFTISIHLCRTSFFTNLMHSLNAFRFTVTCHKLFIELVSNHRVQKLTGQLFCHPNLLAVSSTPIKSFNYCFWEHHWSPQIPLNKLERQVIDILMRNEWRVLQILSNQFELGLFELLIINWLKKIVWPMYFYLEKLTKSFWKTQWYIFRRWILINK